MVVASGLWNFVSAQKVGRIWSGQSPRRPNLARSGWSNMHVFFLRWLSDFPFKTRCAFFFAGYHLVFPNFSKPRNETRQKQWKKTILVVIKHGLLENHQFTFISMISDAIPSYKPADDLLLTATSLPKLWPSRYQDSSGWLRMRRPKLSLGKLPATFSAPIDPAAGIKGRLPTQQLSWT